MFQCCTKTAKNDIEENYNKTLLQKAIFFSFNDWITKITIILSDIFSIFIASVNFQ